MNQVDEFLRLHKPRPADNPTFILEVRNKMHAAEGIKAEVDRQRRLSRLTLAVTLAAGLLLGACLAALVILFPPENFACGADVNVFARLSGFFKDCSPFIFLPLAGCATALGLLAVQKGSGRF